MDLLQGLHRARLGRPVLATRLALLPAILRQLHLREAKLRLIFGELPHISTTSFKSNLQLSHNHAFLGTPHPTVWELHRGSSNGSSSSFGTSTTVFEMSTSSKPNFHFSKQLCLLGWPGGDTQIFVSRVEPGKTKVSPAKTMKVPIPPTETYLCDSTLEPQNVRHVLTQIIGLTSICFKSPGNFRGELPATDSLSNQQGRIRHVHFGKWKLTPLGAEALPQNPGLDTSPGVPPSNTGFQGGKRMTAFWPRDRNPRADRC